MDEDEINKTSNKSPSLSADKQDSTQDIEALIKDAIKIVLDGNPAEKTDDEIIEAVTSVCAEFLKTFIILGYDLNGTAMSPIFYAKTDIEADALTLYMQHYFVASTKSDKQLLMITYTLTVNVQVFFDKHTFNYCLYLLGIQKIKYPRFYNRFRYK